MLHNLSKSNSVFNRFMAEIRDVKIQTDRHRFRLNMERMGEVFAMEISREMAYVKKKVTTPLGIANLNVPKDQPVVATILRAGLPLHQGFLRFFDGADNAFISAYRKHRKDGSFEIKVEYVSTPDLTGRTLILLDPMLATGHSMVLAYKALLHKGKPASTHLVSVIASKQGIQYVKTHVPASVHIWAGAVDEELTVQSYIVPGLGDAGDLAFGNKL